MAPRAIDSPNTKFQRMASVLSVLACPLPFAPKTYYFSSINQDCNRCNNNRQTWMNEKTCSKRNASSNNNPQSLRLEYSFDHLGRAKSLWHVSLLWFTFLASHLRQPFLCYCSHFNDFVLVPLVVPSLFARSECSSLA